MSSLNMALLNHIVRSSYDLVLLRLEVYKQNLRSWAKKNVTPLASLLSCRCRCTRRSQLWTIWEVQKFWGHILAVPINRIMVCLAVSWSPLVMETPIRSPGNRSVGLRDGCSPSWRFQDKRLACRAQIQEPAQPPCADPKSRTPLGFYKLRHRSTGVHNWGIYFLDPQGSGSLSKIWAWIPALLRRAGHSGKTLDLGVADSEV